MHAIDIQNDMSITNPHIRSFRQAPQSLVWLRHDAFTTNGLGKYATILYLVEYINIVDSPFSRANSKLVVVERIYCNGR